MRAVNQTAKGKAGVDFRKTLDNENKNDYQFTPGKWLVLPLPLMAGFQPPLDIFYDDFAARAWPRTFTSTVLLRLLGPMTLFGMGCSDKSKPIFPKWDSSLDAGFPDSPVVETPPKENHPPVWHSIQDQSLFEGEPLSLQFIVTDDDNDPLIFTPENLPRGAALTLSGIFNWTPDYDQEGKYEIGVRASDGKAEALTAFNVTVMDANQRPILEEIEPKIISEGANLKFLVRGYDFDGDSLQLSVENLPEGATFDVDVGLFEWTPNYGQAGTYEIIFRATDGLNWVDEVALVHVENRNTAPVFNLILDPKVAEGETVAFVVSGVDPEGDSIVLSAESLPEGAVFSPETGEFRWTPNYEQAGTYTVKFVAADNEMMSEYSVTIWVSNSNRPPVMEQIGNQEVAEGQMLSFNILAEDPDREDVDLKAVQLPGGAIFGRDTGLFEWTPGYDQAGEYRIEFEATDGEDTAYQAVDVAVENTNRPPSFSLIPGHFIEEGSRLTFGVIATDPDEDALQIGANFLPDGAVFDVVRGVFDWVPWYEQSGNYEIEFRATDGESEARENVEITVENTNRPPFIVPVPDQEGNENEELAFEVIAFDPDRQAIDLSANFLPEGAVFNPQGGIISWTPNFEQAGRYVIEFVADDGEESVVQNARIRIENTNRPPFLRFPGDQIIAEGMRLVFAISAGDPDGDLIQYGVNNLPVGADFNSSSGIFTWTPVFDQQGDYEVTFTADDGSQAIHETVGIHVVNVNQRPTINPVPDQRGVEEEELRFEVVAQDPDGQNVEVTAEALPEGANFNSLNGIFTWRPVRGQAGLYAVELMASDGEETVTNVVRIDIAVANRAPIFTSVRDHIVAESQELQFAISAEDPDGDPIQYGSGILPDGAHFNTETGVFDWTPGFEQAGNFGVEFIADDGENIARDTANITVMNTNRLPVIEPILPQQGVRGEVLSFHVTSRDPDNQPVRLSADFLPQGAQFDPETGIFVWTPADNQVGNYVVVFTAHDGEDSASEIARINITNDPPAVVFGPVPEQIVLCGEEVRFVVSATGPEGEAVDAIGIEELPEGAQFDPETGEFVWTPPAPYSRIDARWFYELTFWATRGEHRVESVVPVRLQYIQIASRNAQGEQLNRGGWAPDISQTGRYVAFASRETNLLGLDENEENRNRIFVKDRTTGNVYRVSEAVDNDPRYQRADDPSISDDGNVVAYFAGEGHLGVRPPNVRRGDIFVFDRQTGATDAVTDGADGRSGNPVISGNGRFVVFWSEAKNLVPDEPPLGGWQVFLYDRGTETIEKLSVNPRGEQSNGRLGEKLAISEDGQFVAFSTTADNLVEGDANGVEDVFVVDREMNTIERVSVNSEEEEANGRSSGVDLSADGRYVVFSSGAQNLVEDDAIGIFMRDRVEGETKAITFFGGYRPSISRDGQWLTFGFLNEFFAARVGRFDRSAQITLRRNNVLDLSYIGNYSKISGDGRFVVFSSGSFSLFDPDLNNDVDDVFIVGVRCFFEE